MPTPVYLVNRFAGTSRRLCRCGPRGRSRHTDQVSDGRNRQ
jgi:hypothetical protein